MVHVKNKSQLVGYCFISWLLFTFVSCLSKFEMMKSRQRPFPNKDEDILPFEKMKEQRMQERMERARRAAEMRR